MPIGCLTSVPYVVNELFAFKPRPKKILDLGVGMGFYGAAIRQWLDVGFVDNFKTEIYGVEGFAGYKNPCWQMYTRVDVQDIASYLHSKIANGATFDAIVMTDVIEHFDKQEAFTVLDNVISCLSSPGLFIVSTPGVHMEQGAVYGNEFERHRCLWTVEEFLAVAAKHGLTSRVLQAGSLDAFGTMMITVAMYKA